MRALGKIVVTGAIAAAALGVGIGTALADPPSGTAPARTDIVGTGSDTTTFLLDKFSTDYNATSPTNKLYSYDALGTSPIQTKGTASADPNCSITRPNGSGAGINTLNAGALTGDGTDHCVDFARSSRSTTTSDPTGLVFVAFARDAITWSATAPADGGHVPSGATLTLAQLGEVFSCNNTATTDGGWRWSDFFSGASTDEIVPVLPQANSGTRSTFLSDIGVSSPGSCVVNQTGASAIEENEGTNAAFFESDGTTPNPDVLFPYSVGAYISQADTATVTAQQPGDLLPQDLTNAAGTGVAPITGTGTSAKIATGLPTAAYRLLYNVVRNAGTSTAPALPSYLTPVFGTSANSGWICKSGGADINSFGFLTISNCGALTASE